MSEQIGKPTTMSENAREVAKSIAKEQQQRPGKKVRVVATQDGFDGFKVRSEGERFVAWWFQKKNPEFIADTKKRGKDYDPKTPEYLEGQFQKPSWQEEEKVFDRQQKAAADDDLGE